MGSRLGPDVQHETDRMLNIRETQLREALALANCGSWEWDVPGNVVIWSPEMRRIIGVDDEFEASAENFMQLVHPDDRDWAQQAMAESIRTGIVRDAQFRLVRPDGCVRLFKGRAQATRFEAGKPVYLVGVMQDLGCGDQCELLVQERDALEHITGREREVLLLVVHGMTSKAIAEELGLSPKTVETYRSRLMAKLHVGDLAGLIRFSIRNGLAQA